MTTETTDRAPWHRRVVQASTALGVWFVLLVALTMIVEPSRDVVVIGPMTVNLAALAGSDTRIAEIGALTLVARGRDRGFVRALYANGAWLVLPSRPGGCISLNRPI